MLLDLTSGFRVGHLDVDKQNRLQGVNADFNGWVAITFHPIARAILSTADVDHCRIQLDILRMSDVEDLYRAVKKSRSEEPVPIAGRPRVNPKPAPKKQARDTAPSCPAAPLGQKFGDQRNQALENAREAYNITKDIGRTKLVHINPN